MNKLLIPAPLPYEKDNNFLERYREHTGRRYIFGRTQQTIALLEKLPCDYIIDTFTQEKKFMGRDIVGIDDIKDGALVLSAVMHRPLTVKRLLDSMGIENSSYYWIEANENNQLPSLDYWKGARGHYLKNKSRYQKLYHELHDQESRTTFEAVLSFRETGNLEYMKSFTTRLDDMYFESFLKLKNKPTFLDLGALDGKNSLDFIKKYNNYKEVLAIEPLPLYAKKIAEIANQYRDITVLEYAISDVKEFSTLYVTDNGSSSTLIDQKKGSPVLVKCETIDNLVKVHDISPDFIKMDIEGYEMKALRGGKETIKRFKPALAVSVYHNTDHLLDSWALLRKLVPSYKFYIRHYTEGFAETVLYAVA
jgi:FkbM family methyltransferase